MAEKTQAIKALEVKVATMQKRNYKGAGMLAGGSTLAAGVGQGVSAIAEIIINERYGDTFVAKYQDQITSGLSMVEVGMVTLIMLIGGLIVMKTQQNQ